MLPKDVNGDAAANRWIQHSAMEVPSEKASNEWMTAAEEAYRLLHDADKARTSPGSEVRIRLATGCGAVI